MLSKEQKKLKSLKKKKTIELYFLSIEKSAETDRPPGTQSQPDFYIICFLTVTVIHTISIPAGMQEMH